MKVYSFDQEILPESFVNTKPISLIVGNDKILMARSNWKSLFFAFIKYLLNDGTNTRKLLLEKIDKPGTNLYSVFPANLQSNWVKKLEEQIYLYYCLNATAILKLMKKYVNICKIEPRSVVTEYTSRDDNSVPMIFQDLPINEEENIDQEDNNSEMTDTLEDMEIPFDNTLSVNELCKTFVADCQQSCIHFSQQLVERFVSSLMSKHFVILSGLSGSGKTQLATKFAKWLDDEDGQRTRIVAVGADWINNEHLLGYPDGLNSRRYVMPQSDVLNLLLDARRNLEDAENDNAVLRPYFLILDEMNLSQVERYFADFLSAMESVEDIRLYSGGARYIDDLDYESAAIEKKPSSPLPQTVKYPDNLFIIGTMNVDETTYMFSPKVLDRAHVIEFRVERDSIQQHIQSFCSNNGHGAGDSINGAGGKYAYDFCVKACLPNSDIELLEYEKNILPVLGSLFDSLAECNAEYGYRTANEILRFIYFFMQYAASDTDRQDRLDEAMDFSIMQKMLPKLHGSTGKLKPVLETLLKQCRKDSENSTNIEDLLKKAAENADIIKYPISFAKLKRMWNCLNENGFASYPEA